MNHQKKLIVLVGPTAAGKTSAAIQMASHFGTHVISADSRQIFRELNIGTAKPTLTERDTVPHHFINSHSIREEYDAAQFGKEALALIHKLFESQENLILCGGSGLYIRAVCEGFDDIPDVPDAIRDALIRELETSGIGSLQEKMKKLDPDHFQTIDTHNPHRLIRALEVILGTGMSITSYRRQMPVLHDFSIVKIGLELPRSELYQRIDDRMDKMISDGLFAEAESLYEFRNINALQTVGYQEIFDFMDGKYDKNEAIRLLKRNSRRYAKRQLTWFKRDPEIVWMNPANIEEIMALASR